MIKIGIAVFQWVVGNWQLALVGLLTVALGVQSLRLNLLQASVAREKYAQQVEINRIQAEADEWANRLIAKQAEKTAVRTETVIQYVDRIHNVTQADSSCVADPRMQLGSDGVREIILRRRAPSK